MYPGIAVVTPAVAFQGAVGTALPVDTGLDLNATISGCTRRSVHPGTIINHAVQDRVMQKDMAEPVRNLVRAIIVWFDQFHLSAEPVLHPRRNWPAKHQDHVPS